MNFDEYQAEAIRTMPPGWSARIELHRGIFALGLAGEVGEVVEHIKKYLGHGHPLDTKKVEKELGDVLWYIAALAHACDLTMHTIALNNVLKLRERYPQGFSSEASMNRKPEGS